MLDRRDMIKGCLIGGAAGDALGYTVEFMSESSIKRDYGPDGITHYSLAPDGTAHFSDDTQMTLFACDCVRKAQADGTLPSAYITEFFLDWYRTQTASYDMYKRAGFRAASELMTEPRLFARRAPGSTCMDSLYGWLCGDTPCNNSKGCGGVMRAAPIGFIEADVQTLWNQGRFQAEVTHLHPLGWLSAAAQSYIIYLILHNAAGRSLEDMALDAADMCVKMYPSQPYAQEMKALMYKAAELSHNNKTDLDNIHTLGEGWVGEEALAIAIYCALRHQDDFSACLIAAVNHNGDSDSTGAVAGNILGAYLGYDAIPEKWKTDLELMDLITGLAEKL